MVYYVGNTSGATGAATCLWNATSACPSSLIVTCSGGGDLKQISANFASRGKFYGRCGGFDSYCIPSGEGFTAVDFTIDVWGAWRAGVWKSSTTVLIYALSSAPFVNNAISMAPSGSGTVGSKVGAFDLDLGVCATVLSATITITDCGGLTIT